MTKLLLIIALTSVVSGLRAQTELEQRMKSVAGVEPGEVRKVLASLQAGVGKNDAKAVGALVEFPLQVAVKGKRTRVPDAAAFSVSYDAVVTDKVRKAVAAQKFEDLFVNAQGVMVGDGEVWISGVCVGKACKQSRVRVTAFNLY